jgi:dTDP-4-amino-4,6-dideoxygalactose transaminase
MTGRTRAVVLAHAWGVPADLTVIVPELNRRRIALVEDAARALGSRCCRREVGTFGIAGCFSFHELKAVPGGEGGLLLTNDRLIYERAVALGHYYRCKEATHLSLPELSEYRESGLGLNYKIHPLGAALARSQFRRLSLNLEAAAGNYADLTARVAGLPGVVVPATPEWADRVSRYGFVLHWRPDPGTVAPTRDTVVMALRAEGVAASAPGNPPLYRLPLFRHPERAGLPGKVAGSCHDFEFPGATAHHASLIRLPTLYEPSPLWVDRFASALEKVVQERENLARWEWKGC